MKIRIDSYYGFKNDGGPLDRIQLFFDPQIDDLDEFLQLHNDCLREILTEITEGIEDGDDEEGDPNEEDTTNA